MPSSPPGMPVPFAVPAGAGATAAAAGPAGRRFPALSAGGPAPSTGGPVSSPGGPARSLAGPALSPGDRFPRPQDRAGPAGPLPRAVAREPGGPRPPPSRHPGGPRSARSWPPGGPRSPRSWRRGGLGSPRSWCPHGRRSPRAGPRSPPSWPPAGRDLLRPGLRPARDLLGPGAGAARDLLRPGVRAAARDLLGDTASVGEAERREVIRHRSLTCLGGRQGARQERQSRRRNDRGWLRPLARARHPPRQGRWPLGRGRRRLRWRVVFHRAQCVTYAPQDILGQHGRAHRPGIRPLPAAWYLLVTGGRTPGKRRGRAVFCHRPPPLSARKTAQSVQVWEHNVLPANWQGLLPASSYRAHAAAGDTPGMTQ